MSVALLNQVFQETRRIMIAGSIIAPKDFRLKRLISPLQQVGETSPVFARLAEAVAAITDTHEFVATPALLTLSNLIRSVLATQGETGRPGELQPIGTLDLGIPEVQPPARELKSLLAALTSPGSDRLETVRDAFQRGAFRDLRLIWPALNALDDGYGNLADYVAEHVLPAYGQAILPLLRSRLDLDGGMGDARRLRLIARLDPATSRSLLLQALSADSQTVKLAALGLLGDDPADVPLLLEQLQPKSAALVRRAAIAGLARSSEPAATEALVRLIEQGTDTAALATAVKQTRNPPLVAAVIERLGKLIYRLTTGKFSTSKAADDLSEQIRYLVESLAGNRSAEAETFIMRMWRNREQLRATTGLFGGEDLVDQVALLMMAGSDVLKERLMTDHASLASEDFAVAFRTALNELAPAELYDRFSRYLTDPAAVKRGTRTRAEETAALRQEAVVNGLVQAHLHLRDNWLLRDIDEMRKQTVRLDPRWLDLAVTVRTLGLMLLLARPGHAGLNAFLSSEIDSAIRDPDSLPHDSAELLHTAVLIDHPQAADSLIASIRKIAAAPQQFSILWYGRLIEALPPGQAPKFEELLAELPKDLAAQITPAVSALKAKSVKMSKKSRPRK